jgi:hypothetical protein
MKLMGVQPFQRDALWMRNDTTAQYIDVYNLTQRKALRAAMSEAWGYDKITHTRLRHGG